MNKHVIKGEGNPTKGKLNKQPTRITHDDVAFILGKHKQLLVRTQKRIGATAAALQKKLKETRASAVRAYFQT